jgi:predicted dehydrogenase
MKATKERCFVGFDAYKQVIASGVDMVILATPPGFRPLHLQAAIEAGKHVFMEKPVAVDPVGVRSVLQSSEMATQKGLGIVAGTQRRHQNVYNDIMKRVHEGAIGDIVAAQCYWNQGGLWKVDRQQSMTDMEWQIRNWLYFAWLSGDHIVEQHVHNLDVVNWALKSHPLKALGMGGRQSRTDPSYGHIYDHFTVEYEYPNGVRVMSMCRQIDNTASRVTEYLVGTKGRTEPGTGSIRGENRYRFEGQHNDPYVQEHTDLIASIRAGKPLNEGRQIAESTLTAIMGRISAYTGQEVTWEKAMASSLNLMPEKFEFGPLPVPPVASPGTTQFV